MWRYGTCFWKINQLSKTNERVKSEQCRWGFYEPKWEWSSTGGWGKYLGAPGNIVGALCYSCSVIVSESLWPHRL